MKNSGYRLKALAWMWMSLAWISCTGDFKEINTNDAGVRDEDLAADFNEYGIRLGVIQQGIYFNYDYGKGKNWPFQMIQNLNADMFSGYMHDAKPLNGGSNNSDYNLQDGWNSSMWEHTYKYIFPQIYQSEMTTRTNMPAFFGITKILKAEVMHRVSDYYGPVVYTCFADAESHYMPDTQAEVYDCFFNELDTAVHVLSDYIARHEEASEFARFDILMDGKYASWIKFANSLRMRLAMRISAVSPEKARKEFLKAMDNAYGVLETASERVAVSTQSGYTNPLGEINRTWNEAFMSASMESILNGYEDPRREVYFEVCRNEAFKGEYRGIRQGTCFAHNYYNTLSKLKIDQQTDAVLVTAAEVWFLRAEAALRGWTDESAGGCYEQGVKTSFLQYGIFQYDDYLDSDRLPADFVDTYDADNDIKARCKVSPRWTDDADKETKLEKIITQKWIAMFPEGCEAWAEQRRTGYPRLLPVRYNHSKEGCIDTEIMIRRLNFPGGLKTENEEQYEALVKALGGQDNAGTRLWWDTGNNW